MATDIIARGMITEYKSGTNISFKENDDGSVTISASGDVSSEDTVARETIDNHKLDKNNPHNVTAEQIGLSNVNNTADLDKPISTAVQTALDNKANTKHTHKKSDITDFPATLPANGGNADTVNNHTVDSDVPADAVFTDTTNSDVTASGNPVQLDGLQGGVPFNSVKVSGKNLLDISQYSDRNTNGIEAKILSSSEIICNGTCTGTSPYPYVKYKKIKANVGDKLTATAVIKSGNFTSADGNRSLLMFIGLTDVESTSGFNAIVAPNQIISAGYSDSATFTVSSGMLADDGTLNLAVQCRFLNGDVADNLIIGWQLEYGDTATAYEPPITGRELTVNVNGTDYTIAPHTNPYTIPDDIRQQDGLNVVTVSEGELSVVGVRENASIKKIWDNMGMDLLFDGVTSADNPAVVDLANYKFVEIHHIMIANEQTYPSNIRLSLDNYLSSASTITTPIHGSSIRTTHTEEGTVSSLYAISAAGSNMNNTKIYGIK